jgi:hypothetical protein
MVEENLGEVFVKIKSDVKDLEKEVRDLKQKLDKDAEKIGNSFTEKLKKGLMIGGSIIAFKKLLDFGLEAKNAARDAEEIRSKFDTVFISLKDGANKVADNFAKNFGLAGTTARDLLGQTGNLLVGFGFTEEKALDLANQVNELAQDLTSFTNYAGGAKGASDALTKALLGETESAKALGIVIRQNSKEFQEEVKSLMTSKGMTENQARALAVLNQAYRQSGKAVGDYARTKDSLANSERRLAEQQKEILEIIGDGLNPVFKVLIQYISELTTNMGDSTGTISAWGAAARSVATPLIIIMTLLKQIGNLLGTVGAGLAHLLSGNFNAASKSVSMGWNIMLKDSESMNSAIYKMWSDTQKKIDDLDGSKAKTNTTSGGAIGGDIEAKLKLLKQESLIYSELYYGTEKWYTKSIELIKAQTQEMIVSGIKKADAFAFEKKSLDELGASYERMKLTSELLNKLDLKPMMLKRTKLENVDDVEAPKPLESKLKYYFEMLEDGGPFEGDNGFVNSIETSMVTASGFVDGFFEDIVISSENANSVLEKGFVGMANAFISQVKRMAVEWLALQAIKFAASFLGIPIPGGSQGGSFLGTSNGVVKLAGGGSFVVPPGFPNDSYPMLVQSGEKVSVTPANRVGDQERLLSALVKRMDVMNLHMIEASMKPSQDFSSIPLTGEFDGRDIHLANKKASKIMRRIS